MTILKILFCAFYWNVIDFIRIHAFAMIQNMTYSCKDHTELKITKISWFRISSLRWLQSKKKCIGTPDESKSKISIGFWKGITAQLNVCGFNHTVIDVIWNDFNGFVETVARYHWLTLIGLMKNAILWWFSWHLISNLHS